MCKKAILDSFPPMLLLILATRGSRGHTKDWTITLETRTLPISSKGHRCNRRGGGGLRPLLSPALGYGKAPALGMCC